LTLYLHYVSLKRRVAHDQWSRFVRFKRRPAFATFRDFDTREIDAVLTATFFTSDDLHKLASNYLTLSEKFDENVSSLSLNTKAQ
jgi:hypothetical protein